MTEIIIQGSEAWHEQRRGRVTASRIKDVMAKGKTGEAATRASYRAQLVAERLSGKVAEGFTTASMKWGTDCEPIARSAYEAETGTLVTEVAMISHPSIEMAGASPDGLVGIKEGGIEVKCPETKTHIDTILADKAPSEYVYQMQWQMACGGMKWVDFISFDPRMPSDMQLFIKRVERDETKIAEIEAEVKKFLLEVEQTIQKLNAWKAKK